MTIHDNTKQAPQSFESTPETIFASATLGASGAYARSSIVPVQGARKITLFVEYDPAASSGYPMIVPLVSSAADAPAAGDDSWFQVPVSDGALTPGALSGTLPAGADYTLAQPQGVAIVYGLAVRLAAAAGATNEYRQAITIDVSPYRWLHFLVAEVGATGSPGDFAATYSLSA